METITLIHVLQEPDYKVVAWRTSPYYVFEAVSDEQARAETTWETLLELANPGTIMHACTFEQSSSQWEENELVGVGHGANWENPVKIAEACACEDKAHENDTTLYVLLEKVEEIPKTSTTPISPTPPADPHRPPNSLEDEHPKDPETDYQDKDNPSEYTHFRIVKVYETELEKLDHTKEIIVDGDYTIFPTNPIVKIEEEGEGGKYSKPDQYNLTAWKISDEYPYGGPTSTEAVPSNTEYDDISVSVKKSGSSVLTEAGYRRKLFLACTRCVCGFSLYHHISDSSKPEKMTIVHIKFIVCTRTFFSREKRNFFNLAWDG